MIRKLLSLPVLLTLILFPATLVAADQFVSFSPQPGAIPLTDGQKTDPIEIVIDEQEFRGVKRAVGNLQQDILAATGRNTRVRHATSASAAGDAMQLIIGSIDSSRIVGQLLKQKAIDPKELRGKTEKYIIRISDGQILIAGSDKRGTIYGIYELSRQLGVSPWYWWADVAITRHDEVYLSPGQYTDGEPVVRYRGIFLNDEAPCLSNWVKEKFPDAACPTAIPSLARGFNHHFYEKVFELLQRLHANYLWPAMWGNAFYADDPMNSVLADEMGIIMGTSHHEPMARNHQEWARNRSKNGAWDYATNQAVIDDFFREGIRRSKNNEDIITIGMRGDGDAAMGGEEGNDEAFERRDDYYLSLYEKIFRNQRRIIKEETGKAPEKRVQLWALYKEVQRYYDLGLTVPEDVIILLCDDNWGNIRRVPTKPNRGGYGMYYHVDYVGAPRSTKWTNVTQIAHLWEQMRLCVDYDIQKLWILNVGDLKPMEYPIDFFLEMAWDPTKFADPSSIRRHTLRFCEAAFGKEEAAEAARIIEQYGTFNGRVTPEMLSARTYNLRTGEWAQVVAEYKALELDALRQQLRIRRMDGGSRYDSHFQLVAFPVFCMANLYEMYYAQAMNHAYAANGDPRANAWADKVEACFKRDQELTEEFHNLNGGKWNHMMSQTHIGYTSWNEPRKNILPEVKRIPVAASAGADSASSDKADDSTAPEIGGHIFRSHTGYISMEADHYFQLSHPKEGRWTIIPALGRTGAALEVLPHQVETAGATVSYKFQLSEWAMRRPGRNANAARTVRVHVISNSTLPFLRHEGHRYAISLDGGPEVEINYNSDCTEENQWHMYDIVATRIIETVTEVPLGPGYQEFEVPDVHTLTIRPIEPGLVLEKIVIDEGSYEKQHLFGTESPSLVIDRKKIEASGKTPTLEDRPLKEVFAGKFPIGVAINGRQHTGQDTRGVQVIKHHFDHIVAENCMKHEVVHPEANRWDFSQADEFVQFGLDNGMRIIGHCLIWHSQCAPWFTRAADGSLCSPDTLKARMKDHITTYMQRYKGKVSGWDVVNEAIMDDGSYRESDFYRILGEEYIPLAFQYAHEADPDVELYYNDYSTFMPEKREGIVRLVRDLKARGLRIDAVGMQSHIGIDYPELSEYEASIQAFSNCGVKIAFSELEMSALPTVSQSANISDRVDNAQLQRGRNRGGIDPLNPYPNGLPEEVSREWNARFKEIMNIYLKYADVINRVTVWGVSDGDSWKNNFPVRGRKEYPLFFDRDYQMKPFLKEISGQ